MKNILLLNGPNLNLLGEREPEIYGSTTLREVEQALSKKAKDSSVIIECYQSNHEGALIDKIQAERKAIAGLIINPGGLSHTSVSLRDALSSLSILKVEVHLSNIHKRESFRHLSYVSGVVDCVICGAGVSGYSMALDWLISRI